MAERLHEVGYESRHYRLDLPDPVEAIKFRMEQQGLTPKDMVPMVGRINRVYEVLNRKRPLTLAMIQRLHSELGIPAESLIKLFSPILESGNRRLPSPADAVAMT